ncbi:myeloid-associated differentiation marker-like [Meriones unguiculatus]|uniref:myeloid-associated differentiation marker-like n=1 Tax=Meriones unguiculatus TaxID=10047 RepID=UPI000B4FD2F5|nr:myeloid-associated differentiation marker-like [Meriones unguiculatus]
MAITASSPTTVGSPPRALSQPLGLLSLLQLISTRVAFCVATWTGSTGNRAMSTWCFCFPVTLTILIMKLGGLQTPQVMAEHPQYIPHACYMALFCLSFSTIYPTVYVQFMPHGCCRDQTIAASTFSCYCLFPPKWPGEITGYMATMPGLHKVFEGFVACVIFAFISEGYLYQQKPAPEWCVAVCAICFVLAEVTIFFTLGDCSNRLPVPFPTFPSGLIALLSVPFYATAIVLWLLCQSDQRYNGRPQHAMDPSCMSTNAHSVCHWDRWLAVSMLTRVSLLVYVSDLVYSTCLVSIKVQD